MNRVADVTDGASPVARSLIAGTSGDGRILIIDDCRVRREHLVTEMTGIGIDVAVAWDLETFCQSVDDALDVLVVNLATLDAKPILRLSFEAGLAARVLVFGLNRGDENEIVELAEAGVIGYHMRSESLGELMEFIGRVARGDSGCSPGVSAILLHRLSRVAAERNGKRETTLLTTREAEILKMLELGLSNQEISARLNIATHTVKNHVHKVLNKIGARSRSQAAAFARTGSIPESPGAGSDYPSQPTDRVGPVTSPLCESS